MKPENLTIEICPGITRRTVANGETMYQMLATLAAGSRMPEHSHSQEQIVHILEGKMRLIVDGVPHELSNGDTSRAMFRMEWKRCQRRACSIRLVRRGRITWRSTRKFARKCCSCAIGNRPKPEPSTFRLVCNSEHDLAARMVGGGLLLCADCIIQR